MKSGTIARLTMSSQGERETFTHLVSFGHIVGARLAPYGASRSASF